MLILAAMTLGDWTNCTSGFLFWYAQVLTFQHRKFHLKHFNFNHFNGEFYCLQLQVCSPADVKSSSSWLVIISMSTPGVSTAYHQRFSNFHSLVGNATVTCKLSQLQLLNRVSLPCYRRNPLNLAPE